MTVNSGMIILGFAHRAGKRAAGRAWRRVCRAGLAALMLALAAVAATGRPAHATMDDLAVTWARAEVAVPAGVAGPRPVIGVASSEPVRRALARIVAGARVPAVVFLHGCDGVGEEEESLKLILMQSGYATFMPNSFARAGRRANCVPGVQATGLFPEALELRRREVEYAIDRLHDLAWVDQSRIYAVGFSEGAMAVASYDRPDVAGLVILGWHCQGNPPFDGIKARADVPVLAVIGADDPWYAAKPGVHCGDLFDGRENARSLVLPDNGHVLINSPNVENADRAKAAILEFLRTF